MQNNNVKCTHNDCFTCPYKDCISDKDPVKKKRGRPPIPLEEKRKHRRERQRKYISKHREEINEKQRENYHKRKKRQQGANGGR